MRVLVVVSHYCSPEEEPRYASVDASRVGERKAAIERLIEGWRNEFGAGQAVLSPAKRAFEYVPPPVEEVSIRVLTMEDRHVLDEEFCRTNGVTVVKTSPSHPRMLGFEAAKIFADHRNRFDVFVFTEDDLLVQDALFLDKIVWFTETFGYRRLLMPSRFEWNVKGPAVKTFIDGDVAARVTDRWFTNLPDDEFLSHRVFNRMVNFRRARNPHSGMHVLTREQLSYWMQQPHWADQDTSFVGPLESSATLGVLKTFAIYKAWGRSFGFLGVEHLDKRYSSLRVENQT
jgi:hypothetical protein